MISDENYEKSRRERINFLLSIGLNSNNIERSIPHKYNPIPGFIWADVITNIIRKLPKMEDELLLVGYKEFAISGHTEGKKFMPWQMFDEGRYIINKR